MDKEIAIKIHHSLEAYLEQKEWSDVEGWGTLTRKGNALAYKSFNNIQVLPVTLEDYTFIDVDDDVETCVITKPNEVVIVQTETLGEEWIVLQSIPKDPKFTRAHVNGLSTKLILTSELGEYEEYERDDIDLPFNLKGE